MKKFLALILTGIMIVSMSVMVFAENDEPVVQDTEEGIVAYDNTDDTNTDDTNTDDTNTDDTDTDDTDTDDTNTDDTNTDDTNTDDTDTDDTDTDDTDTDDTNTDDDGNDDSDDGDNGSNGDDTDSEPGDGTDSEPDVSDSPVTENPNATCTCWYPDNCPSYAEFGYCCGAPDCPCGDNLASLNSRDEQYDRGSEAEALAVEATGVSMNTYIGALAENKTIGEYMNNAVTAAPGLDNAIPVSQGGNVIINGVPSNQTFYVLKVLSGHTDSAKAHAASIGGKVLNVARIDASVSFTTATVNFYMPGVKSGQNIQVYQYNYKSGKWENLDVTEVRNDHVVVEMTSLGVLAFIEVPTAQ